MRLFLWMGILALNLNSLLLAETPALDFYKKIASDLNLAIQTSTSFLPQKGVMGVFDASQCAFLNCLEINPATPYLTVGLLPSPNQTNKPSRLEEYFGGPAWGVNAPYVPGYYIDGENDLVVIVGMTPPQTSYFGLTGYVSTHISNNIRIPVLASMGDTINQYVIKTANHSTDTSPAPFNRPFVLVMGANKNLVSKFQLDFQKQLSAFGAINIFPIPAGDSSLNLIPSVTNPKADEYNFEIRTAYPSSRTDYENYLANVSNHFQVYRLTAKSPVSASFYGPQTSRPKSALSEVPYKSQLDAQVNAFLSSLGLRARKFYRCEASITVVDPKVCIPEGKICVLDNSDAVYTLLFKGPGFFESNRNEPYEYHVFGIRSDKTINATYDSISLDAAYLSNPAGVAVGGVSSKNFDGSTSNPNIFRYEFNRDCGNRKYCFTVPYPTSTAFGIEEGSGSAFAGRTYLQKQTRTAPAMASIVPWVTLTTNPFACPPVKLPAQ